MKIVYLHGLESNNLGPKNDWLHSNYDVFDPLINYKDKNIYQTLKTKILAFKPSLIIGSSMGGYFAHELAKELNSNAVLFNPALHSRSFQPDMTGYIVGKHQPKMYFVLGENDTVINPTITINQIKKDESKNNIFVLLNHEHGTPIEIFKREITHFVEKNYTKK